jgi:hypothetical protein
MSRSLAKVFKSLLTLTALLVLIPQGAFADPVTGGLTGGSGPTGPTTSTWNGGSGNWGDSTNWNTPSWTTGLVPDNNHPGSPFTAILQNSFSTTLDYGPITIDALTMSGNGLATSTLNLNAKALNVNNALTLNGSQTINGSGKLSAGSISNYGTLTLQDGAQVMTSGGRGSSAQGTVSSGVSAGGPSGTFTNSGTTIVTGSGTNLSIGSQPVDPDYDNTGGTLTVQNNATTNVYGQLINTNGYVNLYNGGGVTAYSLSNSGGQVLLNDSGTTETPSTLGISGLFANDGGATYINAGSTITAGSFTNNSSGFLMLDSTGGNAASSLQLGGGTLANDGGQLYVYTGSSVTAGSLTNNSDGILGGGIITVGSDGSTLSTPSTLAVSGLLANDGGTLNLVINGKVTAGSVSNALGGSINLNSVGTTQAPSTMQVAGLFANDGGTLGINGGSTVTAGSLTNASSGQITLDSTGGITTPATLTVNTSLANDGGTLNINTGSLVNAGSLTNNGGGTITVDSSNNTLSKPSTLAVTGLLANDGGTLNITNGGAVTAGSLTNAASGQITLGTLGSSEAASSLGVTGTLANDGGYLNINVGGTVTAGSLTNALGGSITLDSTGGTTTPSTLTVTGSLANDGGSLTINTGSLVNAGSLTNAGGTITVDSSNNTLSTPSTLAVAGLLANGSGSLTVSNGGVVTAGSLSNSNSVLVETAGSMTIGVMGATGVTGVQGDLTNTGGTVRVNTGSSLTVNGTVSNTSNALFLFNAATGTITGALGATGETTGITNDHSTMRVAGTNGTGSTVTVGIAGGPAVDLINQNHSTLDVRELSQMTVNGGLTNDTNSTVTVRGSSCTECQAQTALNVTGAILNSNNSVFNVINGGQLNTYPVYGGSFTNTSGAQFNINTGSAAGLASVDNQANSTVTIDSGGTLNVQGKFSNEGTTNINSTGTIFYGGLLSAGTVINSNSFNVNGGSSTFGYGEADANVFINKSSGILTINGGVTGGGGGSVYVSNFFKNEGSVMVGGALDGSSLSGYLEVDGKTVNALGATLEVGAGTLNGEGGEVVVYGSLTNYGKVTLDGASDGGYYSSGGDLGVQQLITNNGGVTVGGGSNGSIGAELVAGGFLNSGTVFIGGADSNSSSVAGDLEVLGYYNYDTNSDVVGTYTQTAGKTTVMGTLEAALVDIIGGTLAGGGVITSNVDIETGGTLAPGDPMMMTIIGDLNIDGTLSIDVNGKDNSDPLNQEYDSVFIDGNLSLGALSDVDMDFNLTDYTPAANDVFQILEWTGDPLTDGFGSLLNINLPDGFYLTQMFGTATCTPSDSNVSETCNTLSIEINESQSPNGTPEPATLLLLSTGIAGMLAARRKRRAH